ncbi:MdtA/MuxA family multidrug efflux RND transporter periplasmic adaptor subunit [Aquirhabdus sp.]|uniref:MdtA/MuxA family multidrug efflux RND transporter periplasmic adaptor subunit n=1 Tax=Aquirhabdus sp. TaxID=2824160 RepID=UPI00396CF82B
MSTEPQPNSPSNLPPKASQPAWKRWAKWALFVLIVVLIIGFTWRHFHPAGAANKAAGGQGKRGGPGMNQPMPVQTKVLAAGDLNVYIEALGSVVPRSSVTVHPRVDGELVSVNFNEGQIVKKGDLLLQIDPRPYQVALTQAEGQLARDQAQLVSARQDLVRYQSLVKQGSVSQQQVDQQQALVKQYEGTVKSDQGQVDSARLNLTYSRVTAPVSGRLGLRQVDVGNIVHASDANGVVVINQFQPINVTYSIPEDNVQSVLKQVHSGKTLSVDALDRAQKNKLDSGILKSLDNGIDATTGTLKLKAEFANTSENLYPNQFVNVRMLVETQHDVTLLPSAAIQRGAKGTFVFVVNADSTVEARPVTLGSVDGDNTGVISGVKAGEQVVFDGADKLKDGGKVKVIQPQAEGAAQSAAGSGAHHGHRHQTAS